jgi:MSHA pilin protein MshC
MPGSECFVMPRLNDNTTKCFRHQRGFTTIELVVVIVVMGILAAVVAPRLDLLSGFDERGFDDQLKASLQYARKAAVAARHPVCVVVTAGTGAVGKVALSIDPVDPDSVATVNCTTALVLPGQPRGCAAGSVCAPGGVTLGLGSGSASSFAFDPLGRPVDLSKHAIGTVTLTVSGSGAYTLAVQSETGMVH